VRHLVLFAHPLADSLHGGLRSVILDTLGNAGHEVDLCDLYAEKFDPVLSAAARERYFDPARNREGVERYIERLFAAEALVLCFPVWCFGPPAILKGWMDRVMIPGVSFRLDERGVMHPNLTHLKRVVAVTTYGRDRLGSWWIGDPPRKMVTRYLRWFVARGADVRYVALYGIHRALERRHDAFVAKVRHALAGSTA
jgi:putative NADPH-quinone reductase